MIFSSSRTFPGQSYVRSSSSDLSEVVLDAKADAVAMADILHYERDTVSNLRKIARSEGIQVRDL